jgi:hypothetical protein
MPIGSLGRADTTQISGTGKTSKLAPLTMSNELGANDETTSPEGVHSMGGPLGQSSDQFAGQYSAIRTMKNIPEPVARKPEPSKLATSYSLWNRTRSPEAMDEILKHSRDVIEKGITTYSGTDSPLMRSRARSIAAQAVKSYDPTAKASLSSWIMTNLQGLTRYRQQVSPIRVPERVQYELHAVNQAAQELYDELGRDPTPVELADRTGLSSKRIDYVRRFNRSIRTESDYVDEEGGTYLPGVPDNSWENVWAEFVYHDLDNINKKIYDMRVRKGMSVNDIAGKLNMSASAVSQRANKISDMLSEYQQGKVE